MSKEKDQELIDNWNRAFYGWDISNKAILEKHNISLDEERKLMDKEIQEFFNKALDDISLDGVYYTNKSLTDQIYFDKSCIEVENEMLRKAESNQVYMSNGTQMSWVNDPAYVDIKSNALASYKYNEQDLKTIITDCEGNMNITDKQLWANFACAALTQINDNEIGSEDKVVKRASKIADKMMLELKERKL
jgi:hypothetical protein